MHSLVELARRSVVEFIKNKKVIAPPEPLPPEMSGKAGVFVCIKKHGLLRGCIGTFLPGTENIAIETINNAISAAVHDTRFPPVQEDELNDLEFTVDLLSPPEKIEEISELDPKKYGVIVVSGQRKGLLLPDLEGVDTPDEQIQIAKSKAGILPHEKVDIFRFGVQRYK